MAKIYFTYRPIWDNKTNKYNVSYYNNLQFADYVNAGLTKITDWNNFIPENRITKEVVPWVKWLRRAWVLEYNDNLDGTDIMNTLDKTAGSFAIEIKTVDEMRQWIRDNTDLEEILDDDWNPTWQFIVTPERTDEETGETIPAKILVID